MFERRHYEALAEFLRGERRKVEDDIFASEQHDRLATALAVMLARDNPRFHSEQFLCVAGSRMTPEQQRAAIRQFRRARRARPVTVIVP